MDFWDLTKLLFRRWFVSVPLILATLGGTVAAYLKIEPDYVATSYVQFVPPSVSIREPETKGKVKIVRNPWLDTGLNSLGKAALLTVQDARVAEQLEDAGLSPNYTITLDNQLPIVTFEVVGVTRDEARRTTDELAARFSASADALQREFGAPAEQLVSVRRLDMGDNVTVSTSKTKRALVAIFGAGMLLAVGATVAVDALLRRRSRKRGPEPVAAAEPQPEPGTAPLPRAAALPRPAQVAKRFEETVRLQRADQAAGDTTLVLPASWTKQNGQARQE